MTFTVTDQIKADLNHQLHSYQELPFRLTLGAIADYYKVSLTPVRIVVEDLIEEGVLARKSNGRLVRQVEPNAKSSAASSGLPAPIKLSSNIDEQVTNDVILLILQNHQDYLREEATAKKYHTGRTIMRQVFSRLAGAGLIEHVPRCGWKVRGFREKDMLDYLELREMLELKALRLARPFFKTEELEAMRDANIASDNPRDVSLNNNLHDYWISRCDNVYIQDFFSRHGAFYSALFDYAALADSIKADMAQEHRDILNALIAEDWEAAEEALIKHIHDQQANVMELIQQRLKTQATNV